MAFPTVAANASKLPYSVRRKGSALVWWIISNGFLLLMPLGILGATLAGQTSRSVVGVATDAVALGLAIYGGLRLWRLKDPEVQLFADRLERQELFSVRVLYRSDIAGVSRTISSRYGSYFNIVPVPGQGDPISLSGSLRDDPMFADWLRGFPDPDAVAAAADKASVLADDRYGATEGERASRLELAKRIVIGFSIVCAAVAAGVGFLNPPPLAALGGALACIGVGLLLITLSDGLIVWLPSGGVRPSPLAALLPAGALALRGMLTVHVLATDKLMIGAGVIGVAAALLSLQRQTPRMSRIQLALSIGGFSAVLAYGAGAYLDAISTGSPGRSYIVTVEDKSVSHGRSTTYHLDLGPWGDQPATSVSVSSELYDDVEVGSNVCIDQFRGDLGIPWFNVGKCLKPNLRTRDDYLQSGDELMKAGRLPDAAKQFQRAAALDPGSEAALGRLAVAHVWLGNGKAAEREVAKAAAMDPDSAYILSIKGLVAESLGRRSEALADFSGALSQDPKDNFTREQRANVEVQLGSYQAALTDIGPVVLAAPHDNMAIVIKARAYLGLDRLDEVRRVAAGLDPASTDQAVLLTRAHILAIGEEPASALATLDRAIKLKPTPTAYLNRAQLQLLTKPAAARADVQAALKLAPAWPPAVQMLAGIDARARDEAVGTPADARRRTPTRTGVPSRPPKG